MKSPFYPIYILCLLFTFSTASCKKKTEQQYSGISFTYGGVFESISINLYNGTDSLTIIGSDESVQLLITIPQPAVSNVAYSFPLEASLRYSNDGNTFLQAASGSIMITQFDDEAFTGTFAGNLAGNGSTVSLTDGNFRLSFK